MAALAALAAVAAAGGCGDSTPVPDASPAEILAARGAGETLLQQDRIEEARVEFERVVAMAPDDPAGYAGLGLAALRAGDLTEAERRLEQALSRAPESSELELAVARLRWEAGDLSAARARLDAILARDPSDARALWALALLELEDPGAGPAARLDLLARVVAADPGNVAARTELIGSGLAVTDPDRLAGAAAHLDTLRQLGPDPAGEAAEAFDESVLAARTGDGVAALAAFERFRRTFEVTGPYQAGLEALRPPPGRLVGIPRLDFSFTSSLRIPDEEAVLAALRFSDGTDLAGLDGLARARDTPGGSGSGGPGATGPDATTTDATAAAATAVATQGVAAPGGVLAVGDTDLDGDEDLFHAAGGGGRLLRLELGRFVDAGSMDDAEGEGRGVGLFTDAVFGDLDDDRRLDLFVAGPTSAVYRQRADGSFGRTDLPGSAGRGAARRVVLADLDHDGDLDAFEAAEGPNRFYRNDGDGTFTELAAAAGLAGPAGADTRDAAFADIDDDGDLDLVLAEGAGGVRLLTNLRGGRFEDGTAALGAGGALPAATVDIGDIDGDRRFDILVAGPAGVAVLFGSADGGFTRVDPLPDAAGLEPRDAVLVDFDNDGRPDVAVAGRRPQGGGLALWRNLGSRGFEDAARYLPDLPSDVVRLVETDYNDDGDHDLLLLEATGTVRLFRNDGGNANHFIRLDLVGLGDGSRKNNRFGIGARLEVRAGDLLQTITVTDPTVLVGLDGRLKADVIRVRWPNGVLQDLYFPGTDQDLIEQQSLKGSCPLLYVWSGDRFEFVGDVMWKSALGMPLGILGGEGGEGRTFASGYPSQEYRRLPDGMLAERSGEYVMQLTEELWETIYVDEVELVVVDHPDGVDVFVDERFVPPGPTPLELRRVGERLRPESAVDERGADRMPALAARDFHYAGGLTPGRYQGIAEPHELILDLGPSAVAGDVVLYLTGWVFPTDASINTAMAQGGRVTARFPALDVIGFDGSWTPAIADLGFPSGKDKTVVVDLAGRFPTADRRVRIRTNLMVFWDEAFFTVGGSRPETGEVRVTRLEPRLADLHYRGFSREYRRGGPDGPHWFDYDSVSVAPRWSDLAGAYTRYGDVTPLLATGDDMYVIANAGDEITVRFDARDAPDLPPGWRRTFLIYTDGWVKDGDLNTATGDRVDPLPFRAQTRYPYGPEQAYPTDEAHRRYLETYNTRLVGDGSR